MLSAAVSTDSTTRLSTLGGSLLEDGRAQQHRQLLRPLDPPTGVEQLPAGVAHHASRRRHPDSASSPSSTWASVDGHRADVVAGTVRRAATSTRSSRPSTSHMSDESWSRTSCAAAARAATACATLPVREPSTSSEYISACGSARTAGAPGAHEARVGRRDDGSAPRAGRAGTRRRPGRRRAGSRWTGRRPRAAAGRRPRPARRSGRTRTGPRRCAATRWPRVAPRRPRAPSWIHAEAPYVAAEHPHVLGDRPGVVGDEPELGRRRDPGQATRHRPVGAVHGRPRTCAARTPAAPARRGVTVGAVLSASGSWPTHWSGSASIRAASSSRSAAVSSSPKRLRPWPRDSGRSTIRSRCASTC